MVVAGLLRGTGQARAEPSADDEARATRLFQEGRTLMSADQIPEACQKLEESQRLDPHGGTILNLALCHEQEGRLARAWAEFKEAVVFARRDDRRDREVEATFHIRALEPRLPRLTIVVPAGTQVEGLVIERDGHEVGQGEWSTAIPIDGGEHVVRATALGREPFTTTFVIGKESDARIIMIPVLATPVVMVTPSQISSPAPSPVPPPGSTARLRLIGIGAAGVGVVLLGAAGYALETALRAKDDSNADCWIDGCDAVGLQRRRDAVSRGNLATLLAIGGVVLVGAGVTLFYLNRRSSVPRREALLRTRFVLGVAPGAAMTGLEGGF